MAVAPEANRLDLAAEASETAEQLFQEHSGWIYGYCLRLLRSPEEAEDALQTTYLNACRSLGRGTRPEVGSAWLLRIAQNVCFARLRSSGRRGRLERVQDISFLEETVAAPERSPVELIGLTDALCSIPERQREAILLREWQGLSYSEVGARLDLSQAAVETLIFRARRSLAAALEEPGKRGRRKALHALDLGGLAAALKGLFAGGAGIKAVVALTVATATTATVVATDPAGVWRDRPDPATPRTAPPAQVRRGHGRGGAPTRQPYAAAESFRRPVATPVEKADRPKRGRALGLATAAAVKEKGEQPGRQRQRQGAWPDEEASQGSKGERERRGAHRRPASPAGCATNRAIRPAEPPGKAKAKGQAKKT